MNPRPLDTRLLLCYNIPVKEVGGYSSARTMRAETRSTGKCLFIVPEGQNLESIRAKVAASGAAQ